MPVSLVCQCGKRISVSDALVGKNVRCPQCGQSVYVDPAKRSAPKAAARKPAETLHISPGLISVLVLFVLGAGATIVWRTGPGHVWNQWEANGAAWDGEVTDVVSYALQAYLSEQGMYNPNKSRGKPATDGDAIFVVPRLVMSMPEKLAFSGMNSQGKFQGFYNTQTHDIEADIWYGGREAGGGVMLSPATDFFHITGRDPGGSPQAEIDGQSLKIIYPPKDDQMP